jgi:hypothetical protein
MRGFRTIWRPALLATALLALLSADAWAAAKYFKVGRYSSGALVKSITSSDPSCIIIEDIPLFVSGDGYVRFRANCVDASCGPVTVSISVDGAMPRKAEFACVQCGGSGPYYPTVPPCLDICDHLGEGDTSGTAIEATPCFLIVRDVPAFTSPGLIVVLLALLAGGALLTVRRRRATA